MMKLSNKTFYNRHVLELERFVYEKKSLHITNSKSKNKSNLNVSKTVFIEIDGSLDELKNIKLEKFDRILITDLVENYKNLFNLLEVTEKMLTYDGKLILTSVNSKYLYLIKLIEFFKLKDSYSPSSYINPKKIDRITKGAGFEYQKYYTKQIWPFKTFGVGTFFNSCLESIFTPFNLGIKTYMIFNSKNKLNQFKSKSIIIPAKNESGNLVELVERIPKFENTEIIFSYGVSKDNTLEVMKNIIKDNDNFTFKLVEQTKSGKANAVWEALDVSSNDMIAILDADISVEPETLKDFFEIIEQNRSDFVNGTRLIYEMDENSMRFLNKIGNRFFQFFIGKIIKENLTDSLCGTKVFKKSFINDLIQWQNLLPANDPFGDFDLLFAAAYSGQKIVELPIHYKERRYGSTQISRFRDGLRLFKYLISSYIFFNTSRNG